MKHFITWAVGFLAGSLVALLTLALGTPMLIVAVVVLLWAGIGGSRSAKLGGVLTGMGASAIALIALATLRCMNAGAQATCQVPNVTPFVIVGVACLLTGLTATRRAWRATS